MPSLIIRLLDQTWFMVLARVLLTFAFWGSGLSKLINFQEGVAEMMFFKFSNPVAINILTATVQILGSVLIILNRWTWLGAGALGVFTALTILLVHNFWAQSGPEAMVHFFFAAEHVTVLGGLILVAILSRYTGGAGNGPKRI